MDNYDRHDLLRRMVECNASDLYLTTGASPQVKIDGTVQALPVASLVPGQVQKLAYSAMEAAAIAEFERTLEANFSFAPDGIGRFRVNVYQQRHETGMVDYRSQHQNGHILTVEDPIEYLFRHDPSTVDQREVGIDTQSFSNALRNAMRHAPGAGHDRDR